MIKPFFGWILSGKYTNWVLGITVISISIIHKIKYNKFRLNTESSFKDYKVFFSHLTEFIGEPLTVVCSFAFLKGVLLQKFFDVKHFLNYNEIELTFILILSSYFFITSILEVKKQLFELKKDTETITKD